MKIVPPDPSIKSGESYTKVFIEAEAGAALGEKTIEVTAVPETGKSVSANLPVQVTQQG